MLIQTNLYFGKGNLSATYKREWLILPPKKHYRIGPCEIMPKILIPQKHLGEKEKKSIQQ
jgi:hypothetical protein